MFDHAKQFRDQQQWCLRLGSPFTAALLGHGADRFDDIAHLFAFKTDWWAGDASALRFAGALNAAAISGRAPELTALYPPARTEWDIGEIWRAALASIAREPEWYSAFMHQAPQTNETRRSIALLPAFVAAARCGGPLHMREVGASAGLNLNWDRFAYRTQSWSRDGAANAPVIDTDWRGNALNVRALDVATRAGCDVHPLDVRDAAQRLRLKSYIWPDQPERVARFERAADLAIAHDVRAVQADAGAWLEAQLAGAPPEGVTIIYHSVAWQYFSKETDARARTAIATFAAQATPQRRVAWVRFEHDKFLGYPGDDYTVDLAMWPGDGTPRVIAKVDPHVRWVAPL